MSAKTTARKPNKIEEGKKAKRTMIITIIVLSLVLITISVPVVISEIQRSKERVYVSDDNASITLRANGTFTARLHHGTKNGTYEEDDQISFTIVTFFPQGETAVGCAILGDILQLPEAWDDGHSHGVNFHLKK